MLRLSHSAEASLRTGLGYAQDAIGSLIDACEQLREGAPPASHAQLDLALVRLRAIRRDLRSRTLQPGADALYVGLALAQAALGGVTESFGAMRHGLRQLMPISEPPQGWFLEGGEDQAASA